MNFGMIFVALTALLAFREASAAKKSAVFVQDFIYNQSSCEYTEHFDEVTWKDARQTCHNEDSFLITVDSEAVRQKIAESGIQPRWQWHRSWTGMNCLTTYNKPNTKDVYYWDSGSLATSITWNTREPNNRGYSGLNEPAVLINSLSKDDWKFLDHTLQVKYAYLCEKCAKIHIKTYVTSQCNYFYHNESKTFQDARAICKDEHRGYLATVNNAQVKAVLLEHTPAPQFWIGLQCESTYNNATLAEDTYKWESGKPYGEFKDWATNLGNPHNRDGRAHQRLQEPYAFMNATNDGGWTDHVVTWKLPFVCERCN